MMKGKPIADFLEAMRAYSHPSTISAYDLSPLRFLRDQTMRGNYEYPSFNENGVKIIAVKDEDLNDEKVYGHDQPF
jgi:hypothetical protein